MGSKVMSSESPTATAPIPPYLAVASITDPNLRAVPPLDSFQALEPGEQAVKSYQIRFRRPKFPWLLLLLVLIIAAPVLTFLTEFYEWEAGREIYRRESYEAEMHFDRQREIAAEKDTVLRSTTDPPRDDAAPPPAPVFEEPVIPPRPEPPVWWVVLIAWEVVGVALVAAGFFVLRKRGHTFLYVTNRRLIVLELSQGLLARDQAILNFNIRDISGFQLLAQRGLRKLLGLLLLREKRTFYLSIATRTSCNVAIGAVSTRGSRFEPGIDSVALCGALDAQVLALRSARGSSGRSS